MPSTSKSKSNYRKSNKSKFVGKPKQKQIWQVKQPKRNWLELPADLMANILQRIGVFDILENAQKVCSTWRQICKDPAMWRVISMDNFSDPSGRPICQEMCKNAVNRSQGQLVDISITDFCNDDLLQHVADRSSQLKRLEIVYCFGELYGIWGEYLKRFPLLEELSIYTTDISVEDLEAASRCCPMLKTLRISQPFHYFHGDANDEETLKIKNDVAVAVGKNLHELSHLELIGNLMTNIGLKVILDGCEKLEVLDLRRCLNLDLNAEIVKRRLKEIKCVKLLHDSLEDCLHVHENVEEPCCDFDSEPDYFDDSDYDFHEYLDYDDYTAKGYGSDEMEDLDQMMFFMAMFE